MCSWVVSALIILFAMGGEGQEHGPAFLLEPPSRLVFSNGTGARVSCAAHGSPPPAVSWQLADGSLLEHVPELRQALDNGTLVFLPFPGDRYRQHVHGAVYRCRAHNAHGAVLSRDMRAQAVVWQEWQVSVSAAPAAVGSPALLSCSAPAATREHSSVAAWYRDDAVIPPGDQNSSPTFLVDDGWRLVVRSVRPEDASAHYTCSVLDSLTGERRHSAPFSIDVTQEPSASAPRALWGGVWESRVRLGADVTLPCLASAAPLPAVTWYRESASGALREIRTDATARYAASRLSLTIRRVDVSDEGRWACRAANAHGHLTLRMQVSLFAHLTVHVQPHTQIVNSGSTASINCSYTGWPSPRLEWIHNGVPLGAGMTSGRVRIVNNGEQLVIGDVQRGDKGVYQCMARNERDSGQASAEVRLGDTAPELQYTFIEQVLRAGQVVTLKCSASGAPTPHFTWTLDAQPLNSVGRGHRYSIEQFAIKNNEVVSFLNISSVRSEDGGLYTCKAANSIGDVSHTSRLNIYGPPYVRSVGPIRAVAGRELLMYCPYSGYPISSVQWERDGRPVEWESSADGSLRIPRVSARDAGAYACAVSGAHAQTARRDLQLIVSNPPEIEPFTFSSNLQEGKRAQVSCSVTSGDMPVHFTWLKDDKPIPASLQVEERGADFFSNLVFKEVSAKHRGLYTCIASNNAAKVNYTAELVVKVSPKWVIEPKDEAVLAGEPLTLPCVTTGFPTPQVTWMKQRGASSDFIPLVSLGGRYQFLPNGSLRVDATLSYDEGVYICKSENGVGTSLTKTVTLAVNEPARFEVTSHNMSARRDSPATLLCDARGDNPIRVQWSHNMNHLDVNSYRISISEAKTDSGLRSQLYISRTDRQDSGVYKCQAVNAFGHSDHYIYLSVQEKPEAPHSLSVTELLSRAVRLSWSQGFEGNSPLVAFTVQHAELQHAHAREFALDQWTHASSDNVSIHNSMQPHPYITLTKKGDVHFEAILNNLQPHTAYMIRIAAINQIDRSDFTEPVVVKTQEEAPSEFPAAVTVVASAPGELAVSWRVPPRRAWHGDLLGYTISAVDLATGNVTRSVTVNGWASSEATVPGLRQFARYAVRVRAFNSVAAGPSSPPVTATTLEGVPEGPPMQVSCAALSPVSVRVRWAPPGPNQQGGVLLGYKLIYTPVSASTSLDHFAEVEGDIAESKRVTTTDTYLHTLQKYTNYSIQVLAFTAAGDGKRSSPIYCVTEEDVPSAPQKIKVLPYSSDSILVSWLPPVHPNGMVTHFTVYYREAGRLGKHSTFTVPVERLELEHMFVIRSLIEGQLYEVWVSATTRPGEGDATIVVANSPASTIPARIASFGGVIRGAGGRSLSLPCAVVGSPAPRSRWTHAHRAVTHHAHYRVARNGDLHITEISSQSIGNFTCTATNALGEDSVRWEVRGAWPPPAPTLALRRTAPAAADLRWRMPSEQRGLLGYLLHYRLASEPDWTIIELSHDVTSYTMEMLKCGSTYEAKVQAKNKVSIGPPSEILIVTTKGGKPNPPKEEEMVQSNSSAIKINLYAWKDNGCPIFGFKVSYKHAGSNHWISMGENVNSASLVIGDLTPGTWYEISVEAKNDAGTDVITFMADSLTTAGAHVSLPAQSHWGGRGLALVSAAGVAVLLAAAALLLCKHVRRRDQYLRDNRKLSESNEPEREKLRDSHKLYSSSSINGNDKCNDDSSAELYEISPYATFGVANNAGVGLSGAASHSLAVRTLARRDDDSAPHRRRQRRSHPRPHDLYTYDESSLSQCSTVEARHRLRAPAAGVSAGPHWRDASDSDDSGPNTTKGSGGSGCSASAYGGSRRGASSIPNRSDLSGSLTPAPVDISSLIDNYQQRKEQERRECTIHV